MIENPHAAQAVFYTTLIRLSLTTLIGVCLIIAVGAVVFALGFVGVGVIIAYARWLVRSPFLCLVTSGIGFGPLIVIDTDIILAGDYLNRAFWVSLVPFFLRNNLLLLNQFPDIGADKTVGRRHFLIVYGVEKSITLYACFTLAAAATIVFAVVLMLLPRLSVVGLLPLVLAIPVCYGALRHADSAEELSPFLGMNAFIAIATPLILSLTIIYG